MRRARRLGARVAGRQQQTGKGAKANLAIAAILILLGIGSWVAGNPFWGVGLFGLGLIWWLVTRIYAWWRYE